MPGLPRALIKKYGVSKKAWAVFRGRSRRSFASRSQSRGGSTGRKKSGGRRRNGFPGASYVKPIAFSAVAGTAAGVATPWVKRAVSQLAGVQQLDVALGAGTGALAGYMGKKSWKGALTGLIVGALSAEFLAPHVGPVINQATGMSIY